MSNIKMVWYFIGCFLLVLVFSGSLYLQHDVSITTGCVILVILLHTFAMVDYWRHRHQTKEEYSRGTLYVVKVGK